MNPASRRRSSKDSVDYVAMTSSLERRQSKYPSERRSSKISISFEQHSSSMRTMESSEDIQPSPTATILKSLARSVRACHSLGTVPARKKSIGEFTTEEMSFSMDTINMFNNAVTINAELRPSRCNSSTSLSSRPYPTGVKKRWTRTFEKASQFTTPASTLEIDKPNPRPSTGVTTKNSLSRPTINQRLSIMRGDINALIINRGHDIHSFTSRDTSQPAHHGKNLEARICCSRSLYKLSCQVGCELSIIQGGAVRQITDFSDIENTKLLRYCAATLANLTTESKALDAFVDNDGISALLELTWSSCMEVKMQCATALCRISQQSAHASALMRSHAIDEFTSMLAVPNEQLQVLAVTSILNLIYHGHVLPDRVFLGEPHAIHNQLGLMTVIGQIATMQTTTQFAVEVLFNLSLYRVSCLGALRGGGAEILHVLSILLCKTLEESGCSSGSYAISSTQHTENSTSLAFNTVVVIRLLRLIADTLGNFSAFVEFYAILSAHGVKTLTQLLQGALRDIGSKVYGVMAEERLKHTVVSCSRVLANFSSSDELRKTVFQQEMVHMVMQLALLDHRRLLSTAESHIFFCNMVRTMSNLSFNERCTAFFMEFPQALSLMNAVIVKTKSDEDQPHLSARMRLCIANHEEEVKEDALIVLINVAHQSSYTSELLRTLDGKLLSHAAKDSKNSPRLKFVYAVMMRDLLLETRLQQIVYGELVVKTLIDAFYFFDDVKDVQDETFDQITEREAHYKAMNLTTSDGQERFLAAICVIASEVMSSTNVELIVNLALDCLQRRAEHSAAAQRGQTQAKQQVSTSHRLISCYTGAAAALYAVARSCLQRGDIHNAIFSSSMEAALISICNQTSSAAANACGVHTDSNCFAATQAFCAATLYQICAAGYVNQRVIQALINCCINNEENQSLLACSASFAIISFSPEGRSQLIECEHLAKALNRLGRTSHVECQQYAAIAACNVSTLRCIWTSPELKDFIVVALLRANSIQAKQIHAKTLSNLLSHVFTRPKVVEDGALYALMKLSQVMVTPPATSETIGRTDALTPPSSSRNHGPSTPKDGLKGVQCDEVFSVGLKTLFNMSCERKYHQKLMSNGIMTYLSAVVESKHDGTPAVGGSNTASNLAAKLISSKSFGHQKGKVTDNTSTSELTSVPCAPLFNESSHISVESRRYAMAIICNLSSYEENHKELMQSQVMDVIRKYVDQDVETQASAAMILRNLSCRQPWVEMLCVRETLQLLLSFTQVDHRVVKHFAIQAIVNCSLIIDSLHLFGELNVSYAVLGLLETTTSLLPSSSSSGYTIDHETIGMETYMAALKCLHNIAFDDTLAMKMMDEGIVIRLLSLVEHQALGKDVAGCELTATIVHILARKAKCADQLLRQRVVSLCALLYRQHCENSVIAFECVRILMNMSTYQHIHTELVETQAIHVVASICSSASFGDNTHMRECGAITIRNLTLCVTEHLSLFDSELGEVEELDLYSNKSNKRATRSNFSTANIVRFGLYQANAINLHETNSASTSQTNDFENTESLGTVTVSRLAERHLLHGVKYFQREISKPGTHERVLQEACTAIANLSTLKLFRTVMVELGVIETLLYVYDLISQLQHSHSQAGATWIQRICAVTLHRLAVEDGANVDDRGILVTSLLSILQQTDEELHQVRYECEKIAFLTLDSHATTNHRYLQSLSSTNSPERIPIRTSRNSTFRQRSLDNTGNNGGNSITSATFPDALTAATHCVKQSYREQKWTVYLLKSTLSLAAMLPQLEKKQSKVIGLPKMSVQDCQRMGLNVTPAKHFVNTSGNASSSIDKGAHHTHDIKVNDGYLLPVHMDKHIIQSSGDVHEQPYTSSASIVHDRTTPGSNNIRPILTRTLSRANELRPDVEAIEHTRKFAQHMRATRRSYRQNSSVLPGISIST